MEFLGNAHGKFAIVQNLKPESISSNGLLHIGGLGLNILNRTSLFIFLLSSFLVYLDVNLPT